MKHVILLCALIVAMPQSVTAGQTPSKTPAKKSIASVSSRVVPIQLKYIMAPALSRPGAFTTTMRPVTPVLIVKDPDYAPHVCQRVPRVTEALLTYFLKKPLPVNKKRHLDMEALNGQKRVLAGYVNKVLGARVVNEVIIIEGGKSMASGVAARMSFGDAKSCGPVIEAYEKKIKALMAK